MTAVPGKNLRNVADASVRSKNLRNVADEWFEMVRDDSRLAKTRTEQNVYRILAHTLSNTDSCFFLAHTL